MTIATSSAGSRSTPTGDEEQAVSTAVDGVTPAFFSNPEPRSIGGEITGIQEWPTLSDLPQIQAVADHDSYEMRRKTPMKPCAFCQRGELAAEGKFHPNLYRPRKTSWVYRKRGWFMWYRVCWYHMTKGMRNVVEGMGSR